MGRRSSSTCTTSATTTAGGLPETLGDAGFVFTIPEPYTPTILALPTSREVAPWIATIERLWDDPESEARHRALAKAEARRWDAGHLAEQYEALFQAIGQDP
jgi:glycosyltransferase involved in cell wall biosynthesis